MNLMVLLFVVLSQLDSMITLIRISGWLSDSRHNYKLLFGEQLMDIWMQLNLRKPDGCTKCPQIVNIISVTVSPFAKRFNTIIGKTFVKTVYFCRKVSMIRST